MDRPVELVPLVCLQCSTPIPADVDEVAWACGQCGQGMALDEEKGLVAQEIRFSSALPAAARGKPYWVAEGRVRLKRATYGSSGSSGKDAELFWSTPRQFFVPAFASTLENLLGQAKALLLKPPALESGPVAPFEPVTLGVFDIQAAAEFIVVAIEAERADKLREVNFSLELSPPVLWILP